MRGVFLSLTMLLMLQGAAAQPNLHFKRVVGSWPQIEMYVAIGCNGLPAYDVTRQDFRVVENGEERPVLSVECPDISVRCPQSVSLVLDASASMTGRVFDGAKAAVRAFAQQLDGQVDEAALFSFNHQVTLVRHMTTDGQELAAAADSITTSGGTAAWDGTYAGLREVIDRGNNPCRAVILMADGQDNASTHTPAEIIGLATRNQVRIFCVGLGSSISATDLELISLLTGGRYYYTPNASQLAAIFQEIATIISQSFQECRVTYEGGGCADGAIRTVDLQLVNYCGGTESSTKTYRAPHDPAQLEDVYMDISEAAITDSRATVSLDILSMTGEVTLYPFSLFMAYDTSRMLLQTVQAAPGGLLSSPKLRVKQYAGGSSIELLDTALVKGPGSLLQLDFDVKDRSDTSWIPIVPNQPSVSRGCLELFLAGGGVGASPTTRLTPSTTQYLCEGDSVTLTAPPGYKRYYWSTRENTRSIIVRDAGHYSVELFDSTNARTVSNTLTVIVFPRPVPMITPGGALSFCRGDSVTLDAGPDYVSYLWSTGDTSRTVTVRDAGSYSVTVRNGFGCEGTAPPLDVEVYPLPPTPRIIQKESALRADSATAYQWYRNGAPVSGATARLLALTEAGTYTVAVRNSHGCEALSDPFLVTSTGMERNGGLDGFAVYPEPNDGSFTLALAAASPQRWQINVTNLLGQVLYHVEETTPTRNLHRLVDITAAPPGIYILHVRAGARHWTRRIVRR